MFCPICDADLTDGMDMLGMSHYPETCGGCGAALDWAGDFDNGSWHTTVDATPHAAVSGCAAFYLLIVGAAAVWWVAYGW